MADSETPRDDATPAEPEAGRGDEARSSEDRRDLQEVRRLLVGDEIKRLGQLEQEVEDLVPRAVDVGRILPDAIDAANAEDTARLGESLTPAVEGALHRSVRKNPRALADVLFPVLGPAIRKAIQTSLAGMIESFNRTLENSVSPSSLKWRLEARRTGRPFAEVVLLHTLVYRVEQVFLIHAESGLALAHAQSPTITAEDPDLVSAMLKALEDFASDSFGEGERDPIQQVAFGDKVLHVAAGPKVLVAAVVRGNPPPDYSVRMAEAVERVHTDFGDELEEFSGETAPFDRADDVLAALLDEKIARPKSAKLIMVVWVVITLIALGLLAWGVTAFITWRMDERDRRNAQEQQVKDLGENFGVLSNLSQSMEQAIAELAASQDVRDQALAAKAERRRRLIAAMHTAPGLMVMEIGDDGDRLLLTGLRDPDGADPDQVMRDAGVDPAVVEALWQPFMSFEPSIVLTRSGRVLDPPDGLDLAMRGDVLVASGTADHAWIIRARLLAPTIAGVSAYEDDGVTDLDVAALQAVAARMAAMHVSFPPGSPEPAIDDDVRMALSAVIDELEATAGRADRLVRVELRGHIESQEIGHGVLDLKQRRCEAVKHELELLHEGVRLFFVVVEQQDDVAGATPPAGLDHLRFVDFAVIDTGAGGDDG